MAMEAGKIHGMAAAPPIIAPSSSADTYLHLTKRPRLDPSHSLSYETGKPGSSKASIVIERCAEIGSGGRRGNPNMMLMMEWNCPTKFVLELHWLVADGRESFEAGDQRERESGVSEVIYPCWDSIPDSPLEPQNDFKAVNDSIIFHVPLIADEDEEQDAESSEAIKENAETNFSDPLKPSSIRKADVDLKSLAEDNPQSATLETGRQIADVQIAAAAAAACMMVKSLEGHVPVDHDLLIALLKNPALIEALVPSKKGPGPRLLCGQHGSETAVLSKNSLDPHNPSSITGSRDIIQDWSLGSSFDKVNMRYRSMLNQESHNNLTGDTCNQKIQKWT